MLCAVPNHGYFLGPKKVVPNFLSRIETWGFKVSILAPKSFNQNFQIPANESGPSKHLNSTKARHGIPARDVFTSFFGSARFYSTASPDGSRWGERSHAADFRYGGHSTCWVQWPPPAVMETSAAKAPSRSDGISTLTRTSRWPGTTPTGQPRRTRQHL